MAALSEFVQDGIRYVPTKSIAKTVDLSADYLTRFCREGKVAAVFHKGAWYVSEASLTTFLADEARRREEQNRKLSEEAKQEVERVRAAQVAAMAPAAIHLAPTIRRSAQPASLIIGAISFLISLAGVGLAFEMIAPPNSITRANFKTNIAEIFQTLTSGMVSRAHDQLAAASSLPWLDTFADALYRTVCPILRDCPREEFVAAPQPHLQQKATATSSPSQPAVATPQTVQQTVINNPVIERIRETVRTVTDASTYTAYVDARITALSDTLVRRIGAMENANATSFRNVSQSSGSGSGSVAAASITGTLTNAIDSLLGTIADLTATNLTVSATSTTAGLHVSSLDCSSLGNGGTLTTDAFGNVVCAADDGGAGTSFGKSWEISNGALTPTTTLGLLISASSTFSGGVSIDRATTTNATSTNLFATLGRFTTGIIDTLTATAATITSLTANTLVATNATTTRLTTWLADAANGIANIISDTLTARERLCVGETCVNEDQFRAAFENAAAGGTPSSADAPGEPAGPSASGATDADSTINSTASESVPINSATSSLQSEPPVAPVPPAQTAANDNDSADQEAAAEEPTVSQAVTDNPPPVDVPATGIE